MQVKHNQEQDKESILDYNISLYALVYIFQFISYLYIVEYEIVAFLLILMGLKKNLLQ